MVRSEPNMNTLNLGTIQFNHPDAELTSRHHSRLNYNGFIPNYASKTYKNI